MYYFEVDIRVCQTENSDVHRGEALRGLTNPEVIRKRMHQLFCYMTLSLFSLFYLKYSRIIKNKCLWPCFLAITSTDQVGLCFLVLCIGAPEGSTSSGSGLKASQKTGPQLKSHSID